MHYKKKLYNNKTDNYYENVRNDIISLIPDGSNIVLEVGCGKGLTLKTLKELGKAKEVVGIELNERVSCETSHIDTMISRDIEEMDSLPFSRNYFDYIIFADVIEHFIDPWRVLKMLRNYLDDNGSIIAIIPNLRHRSITFPLIFRGLFQYDKDGGILDISHLRFFTRKSTVELFEAAEFSKIRFIDYPLSLKGKVINFITLGLLKEFSVYKLRLVVNK